MLSSSSLLNVSLGKHVRLSLEKDWELREGADCWDEEFAFFISGFFDRASPLTRVRRMQGVKTRDGNEQEIGLLN
jgi:tRNA nucleotidyltransferase (CCA-adding enzyme)